MKSFSYFLFVCVHIIISFSSVRAQSFIGPFDPTTYCMGSGAVTEIDAIYNSGGVAVTALKTSFGTLFNATLSPSAGATVTLTNQMSTSVPVIYYEYSVQDLGGGLYRVSLAVTGGLEMSLNGTDVTMEETGTGITSSSASITVNEPITIDIDNPVGLIQALCEGEDFTLEASYSAVPDAIRWIYNGSTIVGSTSDLPLTNVTVAQTGFYEVEADKAGCPTALSDLVSLVVTEQVSLTEVAMGAMEVNPGETASFIVDADNTDPTVDFIWSVDGTNYLASDLPQTVNVGGNMIELTSIVNDNTGLTSMRSTLNVENVSPAGAPSFSADVQLTVSNNAPCLATAIAVMSSVTSIFPVEWAAFSVTAIHDKQVQLAWTTVTESNNEKFVVERSTDGRSFTAIGAVAGAGDSQVPQNYYWLDTQAPNKAYYRIKQLDFGGAYSYSEVVFMQQNASTSLALSSVRTVGDEVLAQLTVPSNSPVELSLYDTRGVLLQQFSPSVVPGTQMISLPAPTVSGVYALRVVVNGQQASVVFVNP